MPEKSGGILMFRRKAAQPEFLLVHPGGPFWARKDRGAWSIPKGVYKDGEDPLSAAKREFHEETGAYAAGDCIPLGSFQQRSGKIVSAWAIEGDFDVKQFKSNMFAMEWPPKSRRLKEFPEADRIGWFAPEEAMQKILKGQIPILKKIFTLIADKN